MSKNAGFTDNMSYVPDRFSDLNYRQTTTCLYCDKKVLARRLCSKHYNRWWRYGDPMIFYTAKGEELNEADGTLLDQDDFWSRADEARRRYHEQRF